MSNVAFLLIPVIGIVVGSCGLWLLYRKPKTFMSSIDDFSREMKALGREPEDLPVGRRRKRTADPPSRSDARHRGQGRDGDRGRP